MSFSLPEMKDLAYAFMFSGVFVSIITLYIVSTNNVFNQNALIGNISGYSAVIIGFMCLYFSYGMGYSTLPNSGLYSLIVIITQSILVFFILVYTIYINSRYFTIISENKVSEQYISSSLNSALLLLVQIWGIYKLLSSNSNSNSNSNKNPNVMNNKLIVCLLIVFVINLWTLVTATNSLLFFSTDG